MMELISKETAIKAVTMLLDDPDDVDKIWSCDVINNLKYAPTVDAEPVRHGRWIDPQPEGCMTWDKRAYQQCSKCGVKQYLSQSMIYCPHCGAKMDGDGDES